MKVKSGFTFLNKLNNSYLCFAGAALLILIAVLAFRVPNQKFLEQQAHVAVRSIGDALLRANNDFTTPVPPLLQNDSGEIWLTFDAPVVIHPDSLVKLSLKYLQARIAKKSIISVRNRDSEAVVYGFELDHSICRACLV